MAGLQGHAGGLVGVVWVGRDDNTPMLDVTGGRAPAIIWHEIMARALPPRYVEPIIDAPDHVPVLAPMVTTLKSSGILSAKPRITSVRFDC